MTPVSNGYVESCRCLRPRTDVATLFGPVTYGSPVPLKDCTAGQHITKFFPQSCLEHEITNIVRIHISREIGPRRKVVASGLPCNAGFQGALNSVPAEIVRAVNVPTVQEDFGLSQSHPREFPKLIAIHEGRFYGAARGLPTRAGIRSPWTMASETSRRSRARCRARSSGSQSIRSAVAAS